MPDNARFAFVTFVTRALFLMRRGLWIRGHEIIRKDPFLNTLLPDANTLDLYSVSKTLFTQTKNNILKAFREAVDEYNIHPEKLKNDAINTIIFPKIARKKTKFVTNICNERNTVPNKIIV